jgi:nicotinate-nucleotide pyrophosphorylase (carboxylating)
MDIRSYLLEPLEGKTFIAQITAAESGILAGIELALSRASDLGLDILSSLPDGSRLEPGTCILRIQGNAEKIARAEEELLGCIGKPSGVATAAARFVSLARGRAKVVCGAWKKVAPEVRKQLRQAICTGGAGTRLTEDPFVYLDKNFVRMFAGVTGAVGRAHSMNGRVVAVQIRGETGSISEEAIAAFRAGAGILMVDTGRMEDLHSVKEALSRYGFERAKVAFGGGVTFERMEEAVATGADIIDIGRAIIDAPMLDLRLDVETGPSTVLAH